MYLLHHGVLITFSGGYPPVQGRLPTRYSPVRRLVLLRIEHSSLRILNTEQTLARLACVRHAASVHPEPGSNSQLVCILSLRFNIYPISLRTLLRLQYSIQNHCFFEKLSLCLNFLRLHTIFSDCRTIISSYHVTWSNFI